MRDLRAPRPNSDSGKPQVFARAQPGVEKQFVETKPIAAGAGRIVRSETARPVEEHLSLLRFVEPGEQPEQRRLAGAVGPEKTSDSPSGQIKIDAPQRMNRPSISFGQPPHVEQRAGGVCGGGSKTNRTKNRQISIVSRRQTPPALCSNAAGWPKDGGRRPRAGRLPHSPSEGLVLRPERGRKSTSSSRGSGIHSESREDPAQANLFNLQSVAARGDRFPPPTENLFLTAGPSARKPLPSEASVIIALTSGSRRFSPLSDWIGWSGRCAPSAGHGPAVAAEASAAAETSPPTGPMTGLDPDGSLPKIFVAHRAEGGGILMTTHVLAHVAKVASRVSFRKKGAVVDGGSMELSDAGALLEQAYLEQFPGAPGRGARGYLRAPARRDRRRSGLEWRSREAVTSMGFFSPGRRPLRLRLPGGEDRDPANPGSGLP